MLAWEHFTRPWRVTSGAAQMGRSPSVERLAGRDALDHESDARDLSATLAIEPLVNVDLPLRTKRLCRAETSQWRRGHMATSVRVQAASAANTTAPT